MKNLTFTLCFALLCSVGFAQNPTKAAVLSKDTKEYSKSSQTNKKPALSKETKEYSKSSQTNTKPLPVKEDKQYTKSKADYPKKPSNTGMNSQEVNTRGKEMSKEKYPTKPGKVSTPKDKPLSSNENKQYTKTKEKPSTLKEDKQYTKTKTKKKN